MTRTTSAIDRAYAPRFCSSFEQRMFVEYGDKGGILAGPVHAAHVDAGLRFDLVHIPADALAVADGLYRAVDWLNSAESFIDGAAGVPFHQAHAAMEVVLGAYLTKSQLRELVDLCHQWNEAPSVSLQSLRDEDREDVIKALTADSVSARVDRWNSLATLAGEHARRQAGAGLAVGEAFDRFLDSVGAVSEELAGDLFAHYSEIYPAAEAEAAEADALAAAVEADARWSRMAACTCNLGCDVCDPPPADWGAPVIVNGPAADDRWDVLVTLACEHAARMADAGRPWRDGADPVLEFRGITLFDRFAATVGDQTGPLGAEDWGDLIQEYRDAYWARLDAIEADKRRGPPAGYR